MVFPGVLSRFVMSFLEEVIRHLYLLQFESLDILFLMYWDEILEFGSLNVVRVMFDQS